MTVLLIEDDRALAGTIIDYFELDDIHCDYADNGIQALELAGSNRYQVLVLDINLPRLDGFSVCQRLRASGDSTPIIMLTAKDRLEDKLAGFRAGTDDYLVKPFAMDELVARVHALSGRVSRQVRRLTVADLSLDLDQNVARRESDLLSLTPIGLKILALLMRSSPMTVSKADLITAIWGDEDVDHNSLKVHIHKLRKDVDTGRSPVLIHTIKGVGYAVRNEDADQNQY